MINTIVVVVILLAALLIDVATRPDAFRIQRSAVINAPAEKIVSLINSFNSWISWSIWRKWTWP